MPILRRTREECFRFFRDHVAALVSSTVDKQVAVLSRPSGDRHALSFYRGDPCSIPIRTKLGRLFLYIGQSLAAEPDGDQFRLRTCQYWYKLQLSPGLQAPAVLRWEYDCELQPQRHLQCRHHVHAQAEIRIESRKLDLDKVHLPTGWVTIEEVIRFLIVDLKMPPPCGKSWPEKLAKSEKAFYEDFTSKRYIPTPKPPRR